MEKREQAERTPTRGDFDPNVVKHDLFTWRFFREHGSGGENMASNIIYADDWAVVEWNAHETKCKRCNTQDIRLEFKDVGGIGVPIGVHVGARLEPGSDLSGKNALWEGEGEQYVVPINLWLDVFHRPKR